MKKITKLLAVSLASSCLLLGTAATAADNVVNKEVVAQAVAGKAVKAPLSLLFVIKAGKANLVHLKDKEYQLTIQRDSIKDGVLAFSDRPNRKAFRMTLPAYEKMVNTGPNSFTKDPPNIVLTWAAQKRAPEAYKVQSSVVKDGNLTYTLIRLGAGENTSTIGAQGEVAIFVDDDVTTGSLPNLSTLDAATVTVSILGEAAVDMINNAYSGLLSGGGTLCQSYIINSICVKSNSNSVFYAYFVDGEGVYDNSTATTTDSTTVDGVTTTTTSAQTTPDNSAIETVGQPGYMDRDDGVAGLSTTATLEDAKAYCLAAVESYLLTTYQTTPTIDSSSDCTMPS